MSAEYIKVCIGSIIFVGIFNYGMISKIWVLNALLCCSAIILVSMVIPVDLNADVVSEFTCSSNMGAELSLADCCYTLKTQCGFKECDVVHASPQVRHLCKVVYE